jgi:hypothetical protein
MSRTDLTFLPRPDIATQQNWVDLKSNIGARALRVLTDERAMATFPDSLHPTVPELHVFEQAGGWHWGITVPRVAGCGFKLIAFGEKTFQAEVAARTDGNLVLAGLPYDHSLH